MTKVMTPAHHGTKDDMVWTCWRVFRHEVMEGRAFALSWHLGSCGSCAAAFPEEVALVSPFHPTHWLTADDGLRPKPLG